MEAGIHQGGYLSFIQYIAFIDSLIAELENSELCCKIEATCVSPLGYTDDLAMACINTNRIDCTLDIVFAHSRKWRYDFNPKKSAILVFGETNAQRALGSTYRS